MAYVARTVNTVPILPVARLPHCPAAVASGDGELAFPYFQQVVLHPPRLGVDLPELPLRDRDDPSPSVKDDCP